MGCLKEDIVLKRDHSNEFKISVNVPHKWIHHSPDGFEWGYGGSGPADLALNILLAVGLNRDNAWSLHQYFKWRFIANMPKEGGIIKKEDIMKWISEHLNNENND